MRSISKKLMSILLACAMLLVQTFVPSVQAAEDPVIRGTFQYAGMYNNVEDSTLDYAYSDAYFAADARVYNPSLSSMSLCLEMSSWSSLDEEDWVDKSANARELLTITDIPVSNVAFSCGYQNPFAFSRAFKKETGMTPREYREKYHHAEDLLDC